MATALQPPFFSLYAGRSTHQRSAERVTFLELARSSGVTGAAALHLHRERDLRRLELLLKRWRGITLASAEGEGEGSADRDAGEECAREALHRPLM